MHYKFFKVIKHFVKYKLRESENQSSPPFREILFGAWYTQATCNSSTCGIGDKKTCRYFSHAVVQISLKETRLFFSVETDCKLQLSD